jgi:hypothetical protein
VMEVSEMSADAGCKARGQCAVEIGSQSAADPFCWNEFMKDLSGVLGRGVEIVPMRLPEVCACLWLGFTGLDRIGFNPDWPGRELTLTGHAIGHLVLGHCGTVRDGGQFACLPVRSRLTCCAHDQLRRLAHNPAERLSRTFSDREEQAAGAFAAGLEERLGPACGQRPGGICYPGTGFTCIG